MANFERSKRETDARIVARERANIDTIIRVREEYNAPLELLKEQDLRLATKIRGKR